MLSFLTLVYTVKANVTSILKPDREASTTSIVTDRDELYIFQDCRYALVVLLGLNLIML